MRYGLTNQGLAVRVMFSVGGEAVIPDADPVYTLYDGSGNPIAGHTAEPFVVGQVTAATLNIPGSANQPVVADFTFRTLIVSYEVNGVPYEFRTAYRVGPFLPFVVTPESVRAMVGFSLIELPDEDLDLPAAYFGVAELVDKTVLDAALSAGTAEADDANRAIGYRALLDIFSSISMRALQTEQSKNSMVSRFKGGLDGLRAGLEGALNSWISVMVDDTAGGVPTLLVLAKGPDAITGA